MEIYVDTAQADEITSVRGMVKGITTNPTLMRKAGVQNYLEHARALAVAFPEMPISLEVISDDPVEMILQGHKLAELGKNVMVKIPIVNSKGASCQIAISKLTESNIAVNVTAVFTLEQFKIAKSSLMSGGIISVFAGRISDTGVDPFFEIRLMATMLRSNKVKRRIKLLWASTREILNYEHADMAMCDIITMTPDIILKRSKLHGKNLEEFSTETSRMFYEDARESGYTI